MRTFTKDQAEQMLLDYWNNNDIPTSNSELCKHDIKDIMEGDLSRLMIDPHKYDYEY